MLGRPHLSAHSELRMRRRPTLTRSKHLVLRAGMGVREWVCFAVDADTGREVWRASLGGYTKSAPISFTVDGRQVIAVAAGHALFVFEL